MKSAGFACSNFMGKNVTDMNLISDVYIFVHYNFQNTVYP